LISLLFAFSDPQLDFHPGIFPVEAEGDQGETFDLGAGEEFFKFELMEEQATNPLGLMLFMARLVVRLNIDVVEPGLPILDPGKRVVDIAMACANRLYLGSLELDACLELVEDVIIPQRFAVDGNLAGHGLFNRVKTCDHVEYSVPGSPRKVRL